MATVLFALQLTGLMAQPPAGYYDPASGKTGEELQIALHNIIDDHTTVSYTPGVWNAFYTSDVKSNGKVWDMYSDIPGGTPPYEYTLGTSQCGTANSEGDCYSREHSFPKSWFDDTSPMNVDLFHIYPVDQYVNGMRSNYPYGEVNSPTWTSQNGGKKGPCTTTGYTGTVFEPRDEYKGDFARTYFYMATRYQDVIAGWPAFDPLGATVLAGNSFPAFKTWYVDMLLAWHTADPVSDKETSRNNAVYAIQHNRNPFIDHPEYAAAIWSSGGGSLPEPTNHPTDFSGHNIHIQWTDATGATVPDAYLIRMSSVGFSSITAPTDGVAVPNSASDKNVANGIQEVWFTGLNASTTYYFRIFGYVTSDTGNDYKTDGTVQQVQQTTQP
jgi:endonuclease I